MKNEKLKSKLLKITYIVNVFVFISGGIDLVTKGEILFGFVQFAAAFINLLMVITYNYKKEITATAALVLNILVAVFISIDYFRAEREYLQYAWILVAVMSFTVLIIQLMKKKKVKANEF